MTYPRFLARIKPKMLGGLEDETRSLLSAMSRRWEPNLLQAPVGKRILVISPHPDDEAIGAGGLLLAHRGKAEIHIVNVFNGQGGGRLSNSAGLTGKSYESALVAERRKELNQVATRLGAKSVSHMNLPDGAGLPTKEDAERMGEAISRIRPDIVILPWYLDSQRDHQAANVLFAWSGYRDCLVLAFEVWGMMAPNAYFDVTATIDEKVELVKIYQSQADIDYSQFVKGLAATRAFQFGLNEKRTGAVEGYLALPAADYSDLVSGLYGPRGTLSEFSLKKLA